MGINLYIYKYPTLAYDTIGTTEFILAKKKGEKIKKSWGTRDIVPLQANTSYISVSMYKFSHNDSASQVSKSYDSGFILPDLTRWFAVH
jgi:hypothetical protein